VGVGLPLVDPWLENGDPSVDDDFLLLSLSSSSSAPRGGDRFEAAVAVVGAAGVVEERVGVVDEVEDDGEFVAEIAMAAAENEDELFDDNVAVDSEAAPPTLSVLNAAAVPNVPVPVGLPAVSKPRDVEDTASSPSVSPSRPYPSPSSSRVDASPSPFP